MQKEKQGYFVVKRNIFDNKIFNNYKTYLIYNEILRLITHNDFEFKSEIYSNIDLKKGQLILRYSHFERWGIPKDTISRALKLLQKYNYLEFETKSVKIKQFNKMVTISIPEHIFDMNFTKNMQHLEQHLMQHLTNNNDNELQEDLQHLEQHLMQQEQKDIKQKEGNNIRYKEKIYKKESQTTKEDTMKIDLSFIPEEYKEIYSEWIEYRNEIKKPFKSQKSVEANFKQLIKLSNNNLELANDVITQSIANGWQGLFEVKNFTQRNNSAYNVIHNPRQNYLPIPDYSDMIEEQNRKVHKLA